MPKKSHVRLTSHSFVNGFSGAPGSVIEVTDKNAGVATAIVEQRKGAVWCDENGVAEKVEVEVEADVDAIVDPEADADLKAQKSAAVKKKGKRRTNVDTSTETETSGDENAS